MREWIGFVHRQYGAVAARLVKLDSTQDNFFPHSLGMARIGGPPHEVLSYTSFSNLVSE